MKRECGMQNAECGILGRGFLTVISALVAVAAVYLLPTAQAAETGGQAGSFLRIGMAPDQVAMGDCGAALVGGGMGWYYNPAGLPYLAHRQATVGYRSLSLDRTLMFAGIAMPLKPNAGLAFGLARAGVNNIDSRDVNGARLDELSYSDNMIQGSFALMPHPRVGLGISIKWFIAAVPDVIEGNKNTYAYGMGVDLGVRVIAIKSLAFGLEVRDLNGKYSWDATEVWGDQTVTKDDKFPNPVRVGAAWQPVTGLTTVADAVIFPEADGADALQPRFGVEYRREAGAGRDVALRGGWNGQAPTFGLGLGLDIRRVRVRLDYAFVVEPVAPGGSHLIGWVFEF